MNEVWCWVGRMWRGKDAQIASASNLSTHTTAKVAEQFKLLLHVSNLSFLQQRGVLEDLEVLLKSRALHLASEQCFVTVSTIRSR